MKHLRSSTFGCLAGLVGVTAATALSAETWDMATPYPESNFQTQNILQFAEDVKEATDGELTIQVHSANSLIPHPEIRNAVRNGTIPIGELLLGRLANEDPIFELDLMPFLVGDYDEARELWDLSRGRIEEILGQQGVKVLYAVPWPNNGIYSNRPINTVEDLQGTRFRTYNTTTDKLAELVGAVPTQIEVSDIAQAYATGRVDAMITSASAGASINAWDFVDHYYDVRSFLGKNIVIVNEDRLNALPDDVREKVLAAAEAAEKRGWEMSMKEDEETAALLAEKGMKVEKPSAEFNAGLQKIGDTMLEEWLQRAGPESAEIVEKLRN